MLRKRVIELEGKLFETDKKRGRVMEKEQKERINGEIYGFERLLEEACEKSPCNGKGKDRKEKTSVNKKNQRKGGKSSVFCPLSF